VSCFLTHSVYICVCLCMCLYIYIQCYDAVGCAAYGCKNNKLLGCWHGCLSGARCRLVYMAQLMPLPLSLASVKSRLVLPFCYWLTWELLEKGPLNWCVCVCVVYICTYHDMQDTEICFLGNIYLKCLYKFDIVIYFSKMTS